MKAIKSFNMLTTITLSVFVIVCAFSSSALAQDMPRKTAKHAIIKSESPQEFSSFIKEREYLDSPFEIASLESEQLLKFMEGVLLTKETSEWQRKWAKEFIAYLKEGRGEFLMVSNGVYIVYSYTFSGFWLADIKKSEFKKLTTGYNIEIADKGLLADGTGWLLCSYGGLSYGESISGFKIITYITIDGETKVQNTELVSEVMGYTEDETKKGSFKYYCAKDPGRITGIAGEITGYFWKDIRSSGVKKNRIYDYRKKLR